MRSLKLLLGVAVVFATAMPTAGAWSGSCLLLLDFRFDSRVTLTGPAPTYSFSGGSAADLDAINAGQQACAMTVTPTEPTRSTTVAGNGSSALWNCGATLAGGSWNQGWSPPQGGSSPDTMFGVHSIDGSWGEWTFSVQGVGSNELGVAEMTVFPDDAHKIEKCTTTGFNRLRMMGVLVIQG